jgi:hypothetical protein
LIADLPVASSNIVSLSLFLSCTGNNAIHYHRGIGHNEIAWINKYAKPRSNSYGQKELVKLLDEVVSLLKKYIQLAPDLTPQPGDNPSSLLNTLWQPDLQLKNINVDPDTHRITSILDW